MDSPMPGDFWYETAGLKISHFLQSFLRESGMASWSLVRASEQRHDPGKNCTNCKSCIFQSDSVSWRITHYELLSNPSPWPKSEQNKKNALDLTLKSHRPIWATTSEFQGSVQSPFIPKWLHSIWWAQLFRSMDLTRSCTWVTTFQLEVVQLEILRSYYAISAQGNRRHGL